MDDQKLISPWMYRSPNELLVLTVTLASLIIVGWVFFNLNFYIFIGGVFLALIATQVEQTQYLGSAVKVYTKQFPEIYKLFREHAIALGIPSASLYIKQAPTLNAVTMGVSRCTVVLHSALVEQLSLEELSFVLGHELGHFQAGHTKISQVFNPLGNISNNIIGQIINLIFGYWQRLAEYSCDNCGLVLTKNIDVAITTQIKLAIGKSLFDKLDMDAYINQIKKSQNSTVRLSEALALASHPLTANRISNLVAFWKENFHRRSDGVS